MTPAPPSLQAWSARPRWQRVLYWAAVALVFAAFLAACLHAIANVWQWGHNGFNGAAFSQAARNSLRFDMVAQAQYYFDLAPPAPERFYTHHPMLLHFHLMGSYALFGDHEWAGRLVPALYSFGALVMLFLVTRRFLGHAVALIAIALWALTPINLIFANMINHEQGSLFWCLAFVGAYLAWLDTARTRWLVAACAATTMAVQFDWPGYYIAFFVAVHALSVGLRRVPGLLRWRREYTFVVVYSVVVLANFIGFFGWIASVRGDLQEMGHAFLWRAAGFDGYLGLLWMRSQDLHGNLLLVLLALWVAWYAVRLPRGRTRRGELVPLFFLLAQLIHSAVFSSAGAIHAYWVWHLSPALAVGGAVVAVDAARWALPRFRALVADLGAHHARRLAAALAVVVALPLLHHQTAFAWDRLRWGFQTGSASYVYPYDDQYLQIQWARDLARRYHREDTRFLVHPSLSERIEFRWYLDTPIREHYALAFATSDLEGPRPVLLLDLRNMGASTSLSLLVERYGATVWAGRFVAIDPLAARKGRPELVSYAARRQPAGWTWRWLVNPDRPPITWVSEPVPETVRELLLPGDVTPWRGLAGGPRGAPRQFTCPEGQVVAELSVRVGSLQADRVVGAVQPRCRGIERPREAPRDAPVQPAALADVIPGPWFGGRSHQGDLKLACRASELPVGLHGRSGLYVDALGLLCMTRGALRAQRPPDPAADGQPPARPRQPAHARATRTEGGPLGRPFDLQCPPGAVLTGVRLRSGAVVDAVGIECKPLAETYAKGQRPTPPPEGPSP